MMRVRSGVHGVAEQGASAEGAQAEHTLEVTSRQCQGSRRGARREDERRVLEDCAGRRRRSSGVAIDPDDRIAQPGFDLIVGVERVRFEPLDELVVGVFLR